ncbi:MAG: hypothetical protein IKE30_08710 [Clostridia bacterium]|nr:hypothetical protein [Clostridia bacterium]
MKNSEFWPRARALCLRFWHILTNNFALKLLSVVCAVLLWSYVVSSSPNITREKTMNVDISVTGQTVLSSRGLALMTDVAELNGARVRVRVAQSNYSLVTGDNVRVELDLSDVRTTGKQSVRLRGTTTYGSVLDVWPEYVDLEVENQDQRYVPVNAQITGGQQDGYWYAVQRINPSQITVTGPTSLVQSVSSAQVNLDVSGRTETHSRVEAFDLLDASGEKIAQPLSRSTSSVTVSVEIYPTREIGLSSEISEVISGQPEEGYQVAGVEISPESVTVAGDRALLDTLTELTISPIDISGHTRTFTGLTGVNTVRGLRSVSAEEVSVTVILEELPCTCSFQDVQIVFTNLPEGLTVAPETTGCEVSVTGPYSQVTALEADDIRVSVSLAGLGAGSHTLELTPSVDNHPELTAKAAPETMRVVLMQDAEA